MSSMQIHPHLTLTVAREDTGWFVLGESRIGPFSDKTLASELAGALADFYKSIGYGVSVHTSMWTSGPRSHAPGMSRTQTQQTRQRPAEAHSWAEASGAADLRRFFEGSEPTSARRGPSPAYEHAAQSTTGPA